VFGVESEECGAGFETLDQPCSGLWSQAQVRYETPSLQQIEGYVLVVFVPVRPLLEWN